MRERKKEKEGNIYNCFFFSPDYPRHLLEKIQFLDRKIDRQTNKQIEIDSLVDRQIDRQREMERQKDMWMDRQTMNGDEEDL